MRLKLTPLPNKGIKKTQRSRFQRFEKEGDKRALLHTGTEYAEERALRADAKMPKNVRKIMRINASSRKVKKKMTLAFNANFLFFALI